MLVERVEKFKVWQEKADLLKKWRDEFSRPSGINLIWPNPDYPELSVSEVPERILFLLPGLLSLLQVN